MSKTDIVRKFGIAKHMLLGIVKDSKGHGTHSETQTEDIFNGGDLTPKQRRIHTAAYKGWEAVLLAWIQQARSTNLPMNRVVLHAKTLLRLNILFSCSDGWLDPFQN